MKAYDIKYKDVPEKAEGVEDEYDIPDGVTGGSSGQRRSGRATIS